MVVKKQVLEFSFQCSPQILDFVKGLSFKLVFTWHHKSVSVSEAHAKVWHLLIFADLYVQRTVRGHQLEILSQAKTQIFQFNTFLAV